jgi:deazaflavin-dependent oxidoreductase (nitroreductase family)
VPEPDLSHLERCWNCRLTTTGRKTGKPRTVTIWFALGPGTVYLTGGAERPQWCRNLAANPEVVVEIGGERWRGRARVVLDDREADAVRERFVRRYVLARLSRLFGGYTRSVPVVVAIEGRA